MVMPRRPKSLSICLAMWPERIREVFRSLTTCRLSDIISPAFVEPHKAVKAHEVSEVVSKGGRASTKSSWISVELVLLILKNPQIHACVFRKYGNTLRTTVYAQIIWAITELGLTRKFRCTVSPMECVYIPTGQKIMFFGMDDPGKVKSIKVPFGYIGVDWFEELDQFDGPEQIRNVEQSTLRGGPFSMTFKSFNPPAMARNWANRYALEEKPGKLVHHSTYLTTPPEWLGPRFLADAEHLKATNPTAYRHEYLGEVVGSGTQVFENLQLRDISDEEISQFDRIYNGVDWGWYPDPWAWNRMHYDAARRTLYLFSELTRHRTSNQDTAALLMERIPQDELVIADSAEEKSVSDYKAFGLNCRASEKGPGSVAYSMKWLQSLTAIVIDPGRCPDTAREFTEYEYERDPKTNEVMEGYPDVANHHIDAVRYGTNRIWKRRGK
nr:MAG TPA: terminase large subunit [Caudoviricetes sp.]